MDTSTIKAIDTHTHFNHGSPYDSPQSEIYTAQLSVLAQLACAAHIGHMFCSTFASVLDTAVITQENEYLFRLCAQYEWLYQWVVIDPRIPKTFEQAGQMLRSGKCVGIKLHPVYHRYSLAEYADELFSFAARYGAIVQIHPDAPPIEYLPIADKYPDVTFIMAHLGSKAYVDAIAQARYRNIYADTSGSASIQNNIIEYDIITFAKQGVIVFNGPDEQLASGLVAGAVGGIGGTYGAMPQLYLQMYRLVQAGQVERAGKLQSVCCTVIEKLCSGRCNMYAMIKEVIRLQGGPDCGDARAPLAGLTESDKAVACECAADIAAAIALYC